VIELQILGRTASDALPTEHFDQLRLATLLSRLDVLAHVGSTGLAGLTH
jgi:hypothetical protein